MRKESLALGLTFSVLAACGSSDVEPEVKDKSRETVSCFEDDSFSRLEHSGRFIVKSCTNIGRTEFYEGETDLEEFDVFNLLLEETSSGRQMDCLITKPIRADAGASIDCNWDDIKPLG